MKKILLMVTLSFLVFNLSACKDNRTFSESGFSFRSAGINSGVFNSRISRKKPSLKWMFKTSGLIYSTPVISGSAVFIGSANGSFYSLDRVSGKANWTFETTKGIFTSPAISEDMVFFGSYDFYFYSLHKQSGKLKWKYKTSGRVWSSPLIFNHRVIFANNRGIVYILNKQNGKLIKEINTGGEILSSLALYRESLYLGSSNMAMALDLQGELKWSIELAEKIVSSPVIDAKGNIIFCTIGGKVYSLSPTGDKNWTLNSGSRIESSPAIYKERIYFGSNDGFIHSVDVTNGEIKWKYKSKYPIISSPSISSKDNILICGDVDTKFVNKDCHWFGLDINSGKEVWKLTNPMGSLSSPVLKKGLIYYGGTNGYLYVME